MKNWIKAIAILWGGLGTLIAVFLFSPKVFVFGFLTIGLSVILYLYTYMIKDYLDDQHK